MIRDVAVASGLGILAVMPVPPVADLKELSVAMGAIAALVYLQLRGMEERKAERASALQLLTEERSRYDRLLELILRK